MSRNRVSLTVFFLPLLLAAGSAHAQCPLFRVDEPGVAPNSEFGSILAMASGELLAGVPSDDFAAGNAGGVYVFAEGPSGWFQSDRFVAPTTGVGDRFGSALAADGARLLVGAYSVFATSPSTGFVEEAGAAYEFERAGAGWEYRHRLVPSDGLDEDQFGYALAVEGDLAVVGAPLHDAVAPDAGAAYVYEREPSGWTQVAKLTSPDGSEGDEFGTGVGIAGGTVVVGAPEEFEPGTSQRGRLYFFEEVEGAWSQVAKLEGDARMIAADGTTVLGSDYGPVWAFDRGTEGWELTETFSTVDLPWPTEFKRSIELVGERALIGSPGPGVGGAKLYDRVGGAWVEAAELSVVAEGDVQVGVTVAFDGERIALGAHNTFVEESPPEFVNLYSANELGCPGLIGYGSKISVEEGGKQMLELRAGPAWPNGLYFLLGSASGTTPGTPSGLFQLPLNADAYLLFTLLQPNTPLIPDSLGILDSAGRKITRFELPEGADPTLVGATLHHAYVILNLFGSLQTLYASNPVELTLVP